MEKLHRKIADSVKIWREDGYPCARYPLIKAILSYQRCEEESDGGLRYLRSAQLLALETYWYLRLVKETPRFMELYQSYYQAEELLEAMGVRYPQGILEFANAKVLIEKYIEKYIGGKAPKGYEISDTFIESYNLSYPSYIFALAMGTGKTVLIGTIIATEFTMSMKYPNDNFMKNALVFAPGTTIIESLRELSNIDYEKILPSYEYKMFMANLKTHYTSSNSKKINTQLDSEYNLVVSNTEKIIVRRRQSPLLQEQETFKENLRFDALAQLPRLGIFSDEAHHTYGNKAGEQLKRVRETINRLHKRSSLVCVVNTTGTPYYKKQFLKDVVIWYGLAEGIQDNILKSLYNGVRNYQIEKENYEPIVKRILQNFYNRYGDVVLQEGQKAKIAFYFNRQEDLDKLKGAIEKTLTELGEPATSVLMNTQESKGKEVEDFNRLNNPLSQKRVILLVGKGREGWNCPSLFACALITKHTSASNYVLQASARCLRQAAGNELAARIYIDYANAEILNKELQENFGGNTALEFLQSKKQEKKNLKVEILKTDSPRLVIDTKVKHWQRKKNTQKPLRFDPADIKAIIPNFKESVMDVQLDDNFRVLVETHMRRLQIHETIGIEQAAIDIAVPLHLDCLETLKALKVIYGSGPVAKHHIPVLRERAEETLGEWQHSTETVRRVMALIHTKDAEGMPLFEQSNGCFFHTFQFSKTRFEAMKEKGLFVHRGGDERDSDESMSSIEDVQNLSFHYNPYNFSNESERDFFVGMLRDLNLRLCDVEGIYFTGGISNPKKTDIWFEYKGQDKHFHRYFPDFVLFKKTGEWLIVEIKGERDRDNPDVLAKQKAVERLVDIQPNKIQYRLLYCPPLNRQEVADWVEGRKSDG